MTVVPFVFVDAAAAAGDVDAQHLLMPRAQTAAAAGLDLVAAVDVLLVPRARALVATGIAVALPPGFEGQVRPRSGLALKHGVTCLNSPGTIDADYRGEIKVLLINLGDAEFAITRGLRIAQLVIAPVAHATLTPVLHLDDTDRGDNGFGSTG